MKFRHGWLRMGPTTNVLTVEILMNDLTRMGKIREKTYIRYKVLKFYKNVWDSTLVKF